ncbi:hypothetical protein [Methylocystis bryophila]|uniref:hypothetical protein n=1 Tax=Methylocystis bryophila TaxID=655015 RepID=UPI0026A5E1AE
MKRASSEHRNNTAAVSSSAAPLLHEYVDIDLAFLVLRVVEVADIFLDEASFVSSPFSSRKAVIAS